MELLLPALSGLCWTIVYIELIRVGFKQKTYGMPLFALSLNICWECIYTIRYMTADPGALQSWVNLVWFLLDILVVVTYFRYGKEDFRKFFDVRYFIPWSVLAFIVGLAVQLGFVSEFGDIGAGYSAFLQNLLMSVLFIIMLTLRKSSKGQNQLIAVCKWLGTLAPTVLFGIIHFNVFILILGGFCCVFDILYIVLLRVGKNARKAPQPEAVGTT